MTESRPRLSYALPLDEALFDMMCTIFNYLHEQNTNRSGRN